jgi:hypothetical protein
MDMILDPLQIRHDNVSNKYLYATNGVCMRSWRPSQVCTVLQSESDFPKRIGIYLFPSLGEKWHGGLVGKRGEE